jgi:2C-methyl-D-erythritol 2,4-cyclodiphosphate synthase
MLFVIRYTIVLQSGEELRKIAHDSILSPEKTLPTKEKKINEYKEAIKTALSDILNIKKDEVRMEEEQYEKKDDGGHSPRAIKFN